MPPPAPARAWWADVEEVRERIERKRERERRARLRQTAVVGERSPMAEPVAPAVPAATPRRGVREVRPGRHLVVVRGGPVVRGAPVVPLSRSRPRRSALERLGPRPDRTAAWAVVLGFALVLAAVFSAHG